MCEDTISNSSVPIPMLLKFLSPTTSLIMEKFPSRPATMLLTWMVKTPIIDYGPDKVLSSPKEEPKT